jgi:peptide/nickel transport system substrate-binding protein
MAEPERRRHTEFISTLLLCLTLLAGCRRAAAPATSSSPSLLRVGVGQFQTTDPVAGLLQMAQLLSVEALVNFEAAGRPRPWVAEGWTIADSGRTLTVHLRHGVKFHDGTPVLASAVAESLTGSLPRTMGTVYDDVSSISAVGDWDIVIKLRQPSALFVLEALESPIHPPGKPKVSTGPFEVTSTSPDIKLRANPDYYLGKPGIDTLVFRSYPNVRAAWADMLRGQLDMLYEVAPDALDSMEASSAVSTFTFTRRYQYMLLLNTTSPKLRSAAVRRALNDAFDRQEIVQDGLGGHGTPSTGPIWPQNWAYASDLPAFGQHLKSAAAVLAPKTGGRKRLTLRCLVPADSVYERISLAAKRQLEALDVDLDLTEVRADQIAAHIQKKDFDALLLDVISGPSMYRLYMWWHSDGLLNFMKFSSPGVDSALDSIRHAPDETAYKAGVAAFQRAMLADPPAIFLAWGERARAVSNRFVVPSTPGRDILRTMYEWRPRGEVRLAGRN